jgi:DNA replication and repair protein RecF
VLVRRLELIDFRNYRRATVEPARGLTVVIGSNGRGKTNLVEAIAYLTSLDSFRGVPDEALIHAGSTEAVVRAEIEQDDGRVTSVECELRVGGRSRVLVNKQRVRRAADLLGVVRSTVFSPDDLAIVKDAPAVRRRFLDDTMIALQPRREVLRRELARILRQKSVLLKQAGGRPSEEQAFTLDVWDVKLAVVGDAIGDARAELVAELGPHVARAYDELAARESEASLVYAPTWRDEGMAKALAAGRGDEVRRHVCLVGPHRDELELSLNGLPARSHASQGEQRTLALALRLAAHRLVSVRTATSPILLLDDVFSELDAERGRALLDHLPSGQIVLTTTGQLPAGAEPDRIVRVADGELRTDG